MILADQLPPLAIVFAIAFVVALGVFALFLFRGYEHLARRSLERRYSDLTIHSAPQPGDVYLSYHTYHGLIAWFTQTPHHVVLPPDDARRLLGRLLRFNLSWGLLTYGVLFIPPLAVLNYFAQRRSIERQERAGGMPASVLEAAEIAAGSVVEAEVLPIDERSESPSLLRRCIGWIAAGLCVLFGVTTVVCLATGEFEGAGGGVIVTALLFWVARDWLGKRTPAAT